MLFCNHKYRIGSEPYTMIIKVFRLPFSIHDDVALIPYFLVVDQKISDPRLILGHMLQACRLNKNFIEIFIEGQQQINYSTQTFDFHKAIIHNIGINGGALDIDEYLSKLDFKTKYLHSDDKPSLEDLFLNESLTLINYIQPNYLQEKYLKLYQYKARIESLKLLQLYLFDPNFLLRPIAPAIKNIDAEIKSIIHHNLVTFHDLSQCFGILYKYNEGKEIDNCPVSLYPYQIDYKVIEDLKAKTIVQQKLISNMANSYQWYSKILEGLAKHDEFISRMLQIQQKVEQSQTASPYNLCIVRNDFLHNSVNNLWLQVEYNCIAISFGFMSDRVQKFHKMLFSSYYKEVTQDNNVKIDQNSEMMVNALVKGYQLYNNPDAYILVIVGEMEGNLFDQRYMQQGLAEQGIKSLRTSFSLLNNHIQLVDGKLWAFHKEIALVYFRTGYTIDQYDEEAWKIRELIELSQAIKCPRMSTQLVNFKKFQQVMLQPNILPKFLSQDEAKLLKQNYCNIWALEENYELLVDMVQQNQNDYVLKPQREGGGNNYYDEQILQQLKEIQPEKRQLYYYIRNEYILMERIKPVPRLGFMMRRGQVHEEAVISEISVIGYFISKGEEIIDNEVAGYLVRTKKYLDNEGGVAAGYAVVDSFMVT